MKLTLPKLASLQLLLLSVFLFNSAQALILEADGQVQTQVIGAYYGDSLGDVTQPQLPQDPALKGRLYEVLRLSHVSKPGHADRLVISCQNETLQPDEKCTDRKALSYEGARQKMFGQFYLSQDATGQYQVWDVYCQKNVTERDASGVGPGKIPDHTKINAEHTWPQSRFNANEDRNTQKTDLHHLYPTNSMMNQVRSNFEFGEVDEVHGREQACVGNWLGLPLVPDGMQLPNAQSFFEVPAQHKGNVARSLMYFAVRYRAAMTPIEEHYMRLWNKLDPVDARDLALNEEVYKTQGNRNPFVDFPQLADAIPDFGSSDYRPVNGTRNDQNPARPSEPRTNGNANGSQGPQPQQPEQDQDQGQAQGEGKAVSPHRLEGGVFQVLAADGSVILSLQGIVAACMHTNYGVRGASFSSYEFFALDQGGTLHKIRGGSGSQREVKTESVNPAGQTLEQAMMARGLSCVAVVPAGALSRWINIQAGSSSTASR